MFHVLLSYVLNVFIVVVIDCCLTLVSYAFQPVVALINHLLTYVMQLVCVALGTVENHGNHGNRDFRQMP